MRTYILATLMLAGCASSADYPPPATAEDLVGTWCRNDTLCLAVDRSDQGDALTYLWTASDCSERGELTEGLTFTPFNAMDVHTACYAHGERQYHARADFTRYGIRIVFDDRINHADLVQILK